MVIGQSIIEEGGRALQGVQPIRFGASTSHGAVPLHGDLAHVVVLQSAVSPDQLKFMYQVDTTVTQQGRGWVE